MKINNQYFFILLIAGLIPAFMSLKAQEAKMVSRTEYEALVAKVAQLEARLNSLQLQQVDTVSQEVLAAMPESASGSPSLIESVVTAVKQREQQVNFPWMDLSKWAPLREGQTPEQVVAILGEPTLDEPSLNRRIDFVYTYEGRRPATNKKVIGKIRFYKGEAIEIERPVID
jgi:outer membrane protein assembly factor BamE (lipoprotein component of BamABCDE complex)